jgi:hypothetical protein
MKFLNVKKIFLTKPLSVKCLYKGSLFQYLALYEFVYSTADFVELTIWELGSPKNLTYLGLSLLPNVFSMLEITNSAEIAPSGP